MALFPDVMPSIDVRGVLADDHERVATDYTLTVMTWVAVIFVPVVLIYQGWTYWVFRRRISVHHIPEHADVARMRPTDPVVRRQLAPAHRELAVVLAAGVVGSLLVIGQAWAVTALVLAALRDGDLTGPAVAVVAVFVGRGPGRLGR